MAPTKPAPKHPPLYLVGREPTSRRDRGRSTRGPSLAALALDQGVRFDDVRSYVEGGTDYDRAHELAGLVYQGLIAPLAIDPEQQALREAITLDAALNRSASSTGIEHARLWWRGVL